MSHYPPPLPGSFRLPMRAVINDSCIGCGLCLEICPAQAIGVAAGQVRSGAECMGCAACVEVCPTGAAVLVATDQARPRSGE